jgi:hypothetical protein
MDISEAELRDLRKAAMRALKEVENSLKEEPSTVIVIGSETGESESSVNEITSWLFKRR